MLSSSTFLLFIPTMRDLVSGSTIPVWNMKARPLCVRQVTQGVGHECHESIDDANYDGKILLRT
jgi:hypothetical protein